MPQNHQINAVKYRTLGHLVDAINAFARSIFWALRLCAFQGLTYGFVPANPLRTVRLSTCANLAFASTGRVLSMVGSLIHPMGSPSGGGAVLMEKLPGLPAQTRPTRTTASRSFTPEGSVALTADKNFALFSPVERTCFTATFCRCRSAGVVIDPFGLKNTVKCRINLQKAAP